MRASSTILVDQPIDAVWNFVSNVENMDRWVTGVSSPEWTTNGKPRVGATFKSDYVYNGRQHHLTYMITTYQPPTRFGTRSTTGPFPYEGLIKLEAVNENTTRVINTVEAGSDSKATTLIFTLFSPLIRHQMGRQLRRELERLREEIEQ